MASKNLKIVLVQLCLILTIFTIFYYYKSVNDEYKQSIEPKQFLKTKKKPTIFCLIKTTPNSLEDNKTLTVYKVWGHKCDNYRFITTIKDKYRFGSIYNFKNISNYLEIQMPFYVLQPDGLTVDVYGKITNKVYSTMKYVYNYLPKYDWYLIVDDDAYIHMKNLKNFLIDKNSSYPVTYGHDFKIIVERGYHSGGCGYVLSKGAFNAMTDKLVTNSTFCPNSGIDDVDISSCLRLLKIYSNSSIDELDRERFLPVNLLDLYIGPVPGWLDAYSAKKQHQGVNCCSDNLIGVHYMNPLKMVKLDVAFKVQEYQAKLFNKYGIANKKVTFKDVVEHYISLKP